MDWGKLILIFYIVVFLVIFILKGEDQEDFVYTSSVPIGLPIIKTYEGTDIRSSVQDMIGVTIKINGRSDNFTYRFDKEYSQIYQNLRVETEDKVTLIDLIPSDKPVSGDLCLSSTDRRYIRNQETYLVYDFEGKNHRERLRKVRIKPLSK